VRPTAFLVASGVIDLVVSAYAIIERNGFNLVAIGVGAVLISGLLVLGTRRRVYLYVYLVLLGVGLVVNLIPPVTSTGIVVIVGMLAAGALVAAYLLGAGHGHG
jgi:hypothetical protein